MDMKKWVDGNIAAAKLFFEKLVDLVWLLFAAYMWMCAFFIPLSVILMVLSICGLTAGANSLHFSFSVSSVFGLILFFSLPYFYVYKVRSKAASTSYKFFFMCTVAYAMTLPEVSQYRYYAEHCEMGVTKIRAVDAQTREPLQCSVSSPVFERDKDFAGRSWTTFSEEGGNLWLEVSWMGCVPASSKIGVEGYESKTIILAPKMSNVVVELQKIKPVQDEQAIDGHG